jgi:hypothetical protein
MSRRAHLVPGELCQARLDVRRSPRWSRDWRLTRRVQSPLSVAPARRAKGGRPTRHARTPRPLTDRFAAPFAVCLELLDSCLIISQHTRQPRLSRPPVKVVRSTVTLANPRPPASTSVVLLAARCPTSAAAGRNVAQCSGRRVETRANPPCASQTTPSDMRSLVPGRQTVVSAAPNFAPPPRSCRTRSPRRTR